MTPCTVYKATVDTEDNMADNANTDDPTNLRGGLSNSHEDLNEVKHQSVQGFAGEPHAVGAVGNDDEEAEAEINLFDLSYEELVATLEGGEEEAHEVIMELSERTLDMLYQVREEHPDAMMDGESIDVHIANLEAALDQANATQQSLDEVAQKLMDCYAEMVMEQQKLPSPFWSFAAIVGRYSYPRHPKVQPYFDFDDLKAFLDRPGIDPLHRLN